MTVDKSVYVIAESLCLLWAGESTPAERDPAKQPQKVQDLAELIQEWLEYNYPNADN